MPVVLPRASDRIGEPVGSSVVVVAVDCTAVEAITGMNDANGETSDDAPTACGDGMSFDADVANDCIVSVASLMGEGCSDEIAEFIDFEVSVAEAGALLDCSPDAEDVDEVSFGSAISCDVG